MDSRMQSIFEGLHTIAAIPTITNSLYQSMARRTRPTGSGERATGDSPSGVISRRNRLADSNESPTPMTDTDYEIPSMPAPASPSINIHGITSPLSSRQYTEWNVAVDLTADWEDIDPHSLQTATREPRPRTPPQIPPPLSALEKFTRDRSVLHEAARRADFWFLGLTTEPVMGNMCETREFARWKTDVLGEIRVIMEQVEDAAGKRDMKTVGEFFGKVAGSLVAAETTGGGEGLSVEEYCRCVAAVLVELGMTVRMDKFFVLREVEGMVKMFKRTRNAEIKKTLREQKVANQGLARDMEGLGRV